jgi:hypothetical protein
MKSIRITAHVRSYIFKAALAASGVSVKEEALRAKRYDLAEKVRVHGLGGPDAVKEMEKFMAATYARLNKLQQKYPDLSDIKFTGFRKDTGIYASFGGKRDYMGYPVLEGSTYTDARITPIAKVKFKPTDALYKEWESLCAVLTTANDATDKVVHALRATLDGVRTTKQLLERWPEAIELLPPSAEAAVEKHLPAILPADLNKLVGLPTKK